jgi:hypothetical protein
MKWRDFDLAAAFAFVHAGAISVVSLGLIAMSRDWLHILWAPLAIGASAAAWTGYWAWRRKRWLLAAGGFFLALAWPGGFGIVVTGPLVVGLVFVSLIRACQDRHGSEATTTVPSVRLRNPGRPAV